MTRVRTDIIDAYIVRRRGRGVDVLQLRRARGVMAGAWQPVMGHARRGETAVRCMWREVREETGLLRTSGDVVGAWALETVYPYFMAAADAVVLSPCFAVEVRRGWEARLNREHDRMRWVDARKAARFFVWPGQVRAVREAVEILAGRGGPPEALWIDPV